MGNNTCQTVCSRPVILLGKGWQAKNHLWIGQHYCLQCVYVNVTARMISCPWELARSFITNHVSFWLLHNCTSRRKTAIFYGKSHSQRSQIWSLMHDGDCCLIPLQGICHVIADISVNLWWYIQWKLNIKWWNQMENQM